MAEKAVRRGYFQTTSVLDMLNEHLEYRADHTAALWSLLMLEMWHWEFVDA